MANAKEKLRRRNQHRQPFTASALVFEPKSETLLRARTADLGSDGCFVDTLNPFSPGTVVKVRIDKGGATFEASARVVYALASMGMGLVFNTVGPEQLWVLQEWLGDASGTPLPEISPPSLEQGVTAADFSAVELRKKDVHCEALGELILELMGLGLVSEEKGNAILQKLSRCQESDI